MKASSLVALGAATVGVLMTVPSNAHASFVIRSTASCHLERARANWATVHFVNGVKVISELDTNTDVDHSFVICDFPTLPNGSTALSLTLYGCDSILAVDSHIFVYFQSRSYSGVVTTIGAAGSTNTVCESGSAVPWIIDFPDFVINTDNNTYYAVIRIPDFVFAAGGCLGSNCTLYTGNIEIRVSP